ncbi:MAG: OmpA family protein, partial [Pseudomonadota bacterium]
KIRESLNHACKGWSSKVFRTVPEFEDEYSNEDRWIVSYADFITLLFAFFVVMYSISSVNEGKFRVLAETMLDTFEERPIVGPTPIDLGGGMAGAYRLPSNGERPSPERLFEQIAQDQFPIPANTVSATDGQTVGVAEFVEANFAQALADDQIRVRESNDWTEVELDGRFLFGTGSAKVAAEAEPLLAELASTLRATATPVRVEGYTDNRPLNGGLFSSNWGLSAARAASVVDKFIANGVDSERLSATGFGELRPIADNETAVGRARNRRVVVAIAKHLGVPPATVSEQGDQREPAMELAALKSFKRVTRLPGLATISLTVMGIN